MCHASRRRCSVGPEVYLRGASSSSRCAGAQAQRPIAPSVALSLSLHLPNYNLPPHPPSTVHRPPSTVHRPPPTVHRPPPTALHPPRDWKCANTVSQTKRAQGQCGQQADLGRWQRVPAVRSARTPGSDSARSLTRTPRAGSRAARARHPASRGRPGAAGVRAWTG